MKNNNYFFLILAAFFSIFLSNTVTIYAETTNSLSDPAKVIIIKPSHPNFFIKLPTNLSNSAWLLKEIDNNLITPIKRISRHEENNKHNISTYEEWFFTVKPHAFVVPYKTTITLIYASPTNMQNIQGGTFTIITLP